MSGEEGPNTQTNTSQQTKLELYLLQIQIFRAEKLAVADLNGKSDPFCKIIGNKQFFKTKVMEKTLNPEWNEETQFCFLEPIQEIRFEVWDWDKFTKGDRIGNTTLDVSSFFTSGHKGFEGPLTLKDVKTGIIHVKVMGRLIAPSELEERITRLEKETQQHAITIASNMKQIEILSQEKAMLITTQNTLTTNRDNLLLVQQKLNEELNQLTNAIQDATNDVDQLNNSIEVAKSQIEDIKKEIKNCETELGRIEKEHDRLTRENKSKTEELERLNDNLQQQKKRMAQLENELDQLRR